MEKWKGKGIHSDEGLSDAAKVGNFRAERVAIGVLEDYVQRIVSANAIVANLKIHGG